jgi:hypothetical protein
MSSTYNLSDFVDALQCKEPTLQKLSFCASKKPAKIKEWVEDLHATKASETGAVLYQFLPEISRLKTDTESRLAMLEAVRPAAQHVIDNLTRDIVNLHLNTSDSTQRKVIITQAIQKAMIDGYCQCVRELCQVKRFRPSTVADLTTSLHRAITGITLVLMRNYQLYTQPPAGFWQHLHALFQIADYFDLLAKPVADNLLKTVRATNIQTAYARALMLATAKLNQVSQKNVTLVFEAFETWAQYIRLHTSGHQDKDLFYLVNLATDTPPLYKSRFEASTSDRVLQVNFKVLVSLLSKLSASYDNPEESNINGALTVAVGFPDSLIDHLLNCWSGIKQRQQERRDVQGSADICIGLVNTHFYVCGKQGFDAFSGQNAPSSDMANDPLGALTASFGFDDEIEETKAESIPTYSASIQNVSAGGFCMLLKGVVPAKLQSGELIGIKESGRHSWSIGVVRWIRHFKGSTQLGIQNLASQPKPFGAALLYDMGGYSDFMRAFYIPASKNGKTPPSILTASVPFKEADKIKVYDGDTEYKAKLNKSLFTTGSIQQFSYQPMDPVKSPEKRRESNQKFDNDWD